MDAKPARAECASTPTPEARGRALVDAWRQSGLSLSAFARQQKVKKQRIYYWSKRLRLSHTAEKAVSTPGAPAEFVQIAVPVPRSSPPPHAGAATLEILLPGGAVIRIAPGVDPSLLRLAVQALAGSPC
jgi:transposase